MNSESLLNTVFDVFNLLAVAPALWIVKTYLSFLTTISPSNRIKPLISNHNLQLILWLALAGLFLTPILDVLGWIEGLIRLVLQGQQLIQSGTGQVPEPFLTLLTLFLSIAVYVFALWLGKDFINNPNSLKTKSRQVGSLGKTFLVLAVASRASQFVRHIILQVVLFQLPNQQQPNDFGSLGFFIAVAIGLLMLLTILIYINNWLPEETH